MRGAIALALGVTLVIGACSDEDLAPSGGPSRRGDTSGAVATGPALAVPEARMSKLDQPLLVTGFVVAEGDRVRLCEALAESYPPQCGGAFLEVRGLEVSGIPGIEAEQHVRWTSRPRQVLGEVRDGILTVSGTTRG